MSDPNPDKLPYHSQLSALSYLPYSIIIGGYIKGNMHIETVYHNLTHFN